MQFKKYYIKHSKTDIGADYYSIYKKYFGIFSVPFIERSLYEGFYISRNLKINKVHYAYFSLDDAINALNNYIQEPIKTYKGHTLHRCADNLYVDLKSGKWHDYGTEYIISGTLEKCKNDIDLFEEGNVNKSFKEIINV